MFKHYFILRVYKPYAYPLQRVKDKDKDKAKDKAVYILMYKLF